VKFKVMPFLGLFIFCVLFLLPLKLLIAGSFKRFVYHWDAPFYLFAFCLISLAITKLIKREIDRRAHRSTDVTKYITLSVVSTILCVTSMVALMFAIETLVFGKHRGSIYYFADGILK
jgi:hypothetical protein